MTDTLTDIACTHCTLLVPAGLVRDGDAEQFCCPGCRAVYDRIHACGLEDYYRFRDVGEQSPQAATLADTDATAFDTPAYADLYVRSHGQERSTEFVLEGITCAACVWLVERLPLRLPGLIEAHLSLADSTLRLRWRADRIRLSEIAAELMRFGYRPHPARGVQQADLYRKELRSRLIDLGVAGALTGNIMLLGAALYAGWIDGIEREYEQLLRWLSLALGGLSLLWPGRAFFRGAWSALRLRAVNFDFPIAIALATGGIASAVNVVRGRGEIYFDSLAALIFLLLVGRLVQFCSQRRARGAVELLFSLTPATCRVADDSGTRSIPIEALRVGDTVEVRADELFPADGVVSQGSSAADVSLLTGESRPVSISVGDAVYGGARNVEGTVRVNVTAAGVDTRVGRLMRLVERGLNDKPPIVLLTDRVAARFAYVVLTAAAIAFAAWLPMTNAERATEVAVALLIVTCPCVLGLAVPMTFALSIGRLARRGVLVKSASALERLATGRQIILDKTGTLTVGRMCVTSWEGDPHWQAVVSELERDAMHPVGRALRAAYEACEAPAAWRGAVVQRHAAGGVVGEADDCRVAVGSPRLMNAIKATWPEALRLAVVRHEQAGRTVIGVAVNEVIRAVAALSDTLRDDTASAVAALREREFGTQICSGDAQGVVDDIARTLGIPNQSATGGMTPEGKLAHVRAAKTVMVGDGVNDAAALAAADVGIAVAGGAEAALAAADIYVARPGLGGVVDAIDTSRHALAVVRRNVVIATSYNVLAGTLAALGYMHPLMAACLMPLSSVTVLTLTVLATRRGPRKGQS